MNTVHRLSCVVGVVLWVAAGQTAAGADTIVYCLTERDALGNRGKALYRIHTDGTQATRILPANPLGKRIREPNVGPIGRKIALFVYPTVYTCDVDGSHLAKLVDLPREHWEPRWSPDGARIVFTTDRHENADIYVMNADSSGQRNLTLSPLSNDMNPAWGPEGKHIVFASDRRGNFDIFVMDDGGLGLHPLTSSLADDRLPVWSPARGTIVFVSERDGNREIYVMNADGTRLRNVTNHPADDWGPAWGVTP